MSKRITIRVPLRAVGILILSLLLVNLAALLLPIIPVVGSVGWLDGWNYRKSHVIGNATGAGTEYQVKITTFYNETGMSVAEYKSTETWLITYDGVTFDSDATNIFEANGETIKKYNLATHGLLFTSENIKTRFAEMTIPDPGDICYYDGKIYIAVGESTGPNGAAKIGVYSAANLAFIEKIDISAQCSVGWGISSVAYYNSRFWVGYYKVPAGDQGATDYAEVLEYSVAWAYQDNHVLAYPCIQGLDWRDGHLIASSQDVYAGHLKSAWVEYVDWVVYRYIEDEGNWGGCGFQPNSPYIWHSTGAVANSEIWVYPPVSQISLEEHCRTDFGDVRFTDNDGETLIDYFLLEKEDSVNATFLVEVADDLSSVDQTIYVYYGNAAATTTSSGPNTFPWLFDDFNDYSINDPPNAVDWDVLLNGDTIDVQLDPVDASRKCFKFVESGDDQFTWMYALFKANRTGLAFNFRLRYNVDGMYYYGGFEGPTQIINTARRSAEDTHRWMDDIPVWYDFSPQMVAALNTWYEIEWMAANAGTDYMGWRQDGVLGTGGFKVAPTVGIDTLRFYPLKTPAKILYVGGIGTDGRYIFVRKLVDPEPEHGAWGAEEEAPLATTSVSATTCVTSHFTTTVTSITTTTDEIVTTSTGIACTSVYSTTCMSGTTVVDSTESVDVTHSVDETVTVSVDETIYTTTVDSITTTISVTTCTSVHHTTTATSKTTTTDEIITTSSDTTCTSVSSTTCMTGTSTVNTYTKSIDATHSIDETVTVVVDETVYTTPPSEDWWNTDWWYRIRVDITSGYGALTNYPIYLDIHVADGTSSGHDIYTDGKAQSDYDDIRVIANDQETLLSIWQVDNYTWSYPDTRFWVKVPSIPTTIWVYWDNDDASSVSNGFNVFPFFDDFEVDAAAGIWTNHTGGEDWVPIVNDWFLEAESAAASGGWSALECNNRQTLIGGSPTYGWSMEWDQHIRTYGTEVSGNEFCLGALGNDWQHDVGAADLDHTYYGISTTYRDITPWANRPVIFDEWDGVGDERQANQTAFPFSAWGFGDNQARGNLPSKWTYMQMVMFSDTAYVKLNGTILRKLGSTPLLNHLTRSQGPTFSSKAWAGANDYLRIGANWVFMRPIADPEPSLAMGEGEGLDIDMGILNMEDCGGYGNWTFEGWTQYIFWINVSAPGVDGSEMSVGIGFYDDSGDWYSFFYSNATGRATLVSPDEGISAALRSVTTGDEWAYVTFNVIFNPYVADTFDVDLYARAIIPVFGDTGWIVGKADYFNIYNLGGYVSTAVTGTAGRLLGGDVFELWASKGGRVRANLTYKNLQRVGFLMEIGFPTDKDPGGGSFGYARYGIDVCWNDTWHETLMVQIEPWDIGMDVANAWFEYYVTWFYNGDMVEEEIIKINALWEGGTAATTEKQSARLWVDLWFNRMNASTTMGGRVNSYWYGMRKDVTWWLPLTVIFTDWQPLITNYTRAMHFDNLVIDGEVRSCTELDLMRAWCEVYHLAIGDEFNLTVRNYDVFNVEIAPASMRGVDTPIFTDTEVYDVSGGGFFAGLISGLLFGMSKFWTSTKTEGLAAWSYFKGFMDVLFGAIGFPGLVSTLEDLGSVFFGYMNTVLAEGFLYDLITMIFIIPTQTFGHLIYWGLEFINTWIEIGNIVVSILDGTHSIVVGAVNIWDLMSFNEWSEAIPIFMVVSWIVSLDSRAKKGVDGQFTLAVKDIQLALSILAFFMATMFKALDVFLDTVFRMAGLIRG